MYVRQPQPTAGCAACGSTVVRKPRALGAIISPLGFISILGLIVTGIVVTRAAKKANF